MKFEIEGIEELQKKLKSNITLKDVKRVVGYNGSQLQQKIQLAADFDKGYQTGATKRSVTLSIKDSGFTAEAKPTTKYSPYLEYGTRFMEAQPFVRPAFNHQKEKFKNDMDKLVR